MASDIIFALSTPFGKSGIAVFRISGKDLSPYFLDLDLAENMPPRRVQYSHLLRQDGKVIDDILAVYFQAPNSFTGEDVLEISTHGSLAVIEAVVQRFKQFPGWRLAQPGEFSRRAFYNGKMDLAQAEGLADILEATTERQLHLAQRQAWGRLSDQVRTWRKKIVQLQALAEASIDFSEDLDQDIDDHIRAASAVFVEELEAALEKGRRALKLKRGFSVAIVGPPNAGKSSLLNALMERNLAIVTNIAGTTRDPIGAETHLKGWPIRFIDTAGLRKTSDPIEAAGIELTNNTLKEADVVLSLAAPKQDFIELQGQHFRVRTHADLISMPREAPDECFISSTTMLGIEDLKERIAQFLSDKWPDIESALFVQERQQNSVGKAINELSYIADAPTLDIIGERLRYAAQALAEITGDVDVEDILDVVFSQFCIGK